jgi:hypothetical protein
MSLPLLQCLLLSQLMPLLLTETFRQALLVAGVVVAFIVERLRTLGGVISDVHITRRMLVEGVDSIQLFREQTGLLQLLFMLMLLV